MSQPATPPKKPTYSTPRSRRLADRAARWVVTAGGLGIIVSILGILAFIVIEILPVVRSGHVRTQAQLDSGFPVSAVIGDEYRSKLATLEPDGTVRIASISGEQPETVIRPLDDAPELLPLRAVASPPGQMAFHAIAANGSIVHLPFRWRIRFDESTRVVEGTLDDPVVFSTRDEDAPAGEDGGVNADSSANADVSSTDVTVYASRVDNDGNGTAVFQDSSNRLTVIRRTVEENLFTEEIEETWSRETVQAEPLSEVVLDQEQLNLYGAGTDGALYWWRLKNGVPELGDQAQVGGKIGALSLLIGDRSIVVGGDDGVLSVWFVVRQPDESFELTRIRDFPALEGRIRKIAPSFRNKGFAAVTDQEKLGLYYSTSNRTIWKGEAPVPGEALFFSPKNDGLVIGGATAVAFLEVENAHPEISWKSLFGKVWYEGRPGPQYVWQSTGGTDDFESKISLTPLIVGTLKGTFYSLFLAIPLAVLGAMYTAHFIHPRLKQTIKPIVEVMASLPSVVLGFLAGLWLAPRVQKFFPGLVLMLLILPLAVLIAGWCWRRLPLRIRSSVPAGSELVVYAITLLLASWLCLNLEMPFEQWAFGGDFRAWLLNRTGMVYDSLNALVVGLAMGFAVIPIIFSIAEDAFSNVPQNLVSGSLALGATRWQTVTRVVLPTASPGIFSAIMIGFGRAIGETMIVVMATGNTPIMDWSPFNGFRTLSANIAVEIPEAPQGGTLYRTLFLAAFILFIFTFVLNTFAELVRQRLRTRYSQL